MLRRFGMVDPDGPPTESRVTVGFRCPDCSTVVSRGMVVRRFERFADLGEVSWPPVDLGGGDA